MSERTQAKASSGGQERPARVLDAVTATPGPAAPTSTSHARLQPLDYRAAALDRAGLLGAWQELNRTATIDHCIARLESSGNLENLRRVGDPAAGGYHGLWFADSDIYKVLEAVGWETGRDGDAGWSAFVDATVALLREVQDEDGYLNSWIQGVHPERRWQQLAGEPRAVLRRPPDPGRRRPRARSRPR